MQPMSWKCFALIAVAMCSLAMAAPAPQSLDELSPVEATEGLISGVDRDKRKILGPEVGFGVKNAILGYVFGKIDGILDAKTKLLDQFDQTNVAKNKAAGIEAPAPISSLQQLLSAVIQPKIAAISAKFGALSSGSAGGLGGLSSGSSGLGGLSGGFGGAAPAPAATDDDDEDHAELSESVAPSSGSGNILSSFLRLSGPILSSSSAGTKVGQPASDIPDDSDE